MSVVQTVDGDVVIRGSLTATGAVNLPAGSVANAAIASVADIDASKMEHQYELTLSGALGAAAATEARVIHVVYGATGAILAFRAGAVVAAGTSTTLSIDLKKNGTTVLSAPISLSNAQAAYQLASGTVAVPGLVSGDVLTAHATLSGSNAAQGWFCQVVLREDAA